MKKGSIGTSPWISSGKFIVASTLLFLTDSFSHGQFRVLEEPLASRFGEDSDFFCAWNDDAELSTLLNAIYPIHRESHGLTLSQVFQPESRGKNLLHLIQTESRTPRDQIGHFIIRSGELLLSADNFANSAHEQMGTLASSYCPSNVEE